jgi:ankyrin repeat protein
VHGADPNACTNERSTPLHFASEYGNVEIVRVLIEHGADVEVKDLKGKTPLVLASEGGHEDIIELLRASLHCTI